MYHRSLKSCASLCLLLGFTSAAAAQEAPFLNGKPYMPLQIAYVTKKDAAKQTLTVCFPQSGQCNTLHNANFHGTAAACTQAGLKAIVKAAFTPEERKAIVNVGGIRSAIAATYPDSYPVKAALFDCSATTLPYWQGVYCQSKDATNILVTCAYVADNPAEVTLIPQDDIDHPPELQVEASRTPKTTRLRLSP